MKSDKPNYIDMQKLNVVLAYHGGDIELTKNLLRWVLKQNGGVQLPNTILLFGDGALSREQRAEVKTIAMDSFMDVRSYPVHVETSMQKWPTGPNLMFLQAMRTCQENFRDSWLWLEPDSTPLKAGWLQTLEKAYYGQPSRYFGTWSVRGQGSSELPERWMSGVGVYPNDAFTELAVFCGSEKPFDVVANTVTSSRLRETDLIQQYWGTKDVPPTFGPVSIAGTNILGASELRPEAVLFHRVKDGSLIRVLSGIPVTPSVAEEVAIQPKGAESAKAPSFRPPSPIPGVASEFGGGVTRTMAISNDPSKPVQTKAL